VWAVYASADEKTKARSAADDAENWLYSEEVRDQ